MEKGFSGQCPCRELHKCAVVIFQDVANLGSDLQGARDDILNLQQFRTAIQNQVDQLVSADAAACRLAALLSILVYVSHRRRRLYVCHGLSVVDTYTVHVKA